MSTAHMPLKTWNWLAPRIPCIFASRLLKTCMNNWNHFLWIIFWIHIKRIQTSSLAPDIFTCNNEHDCNFVTFFFVTFWKYITIWTIDIKLLLIYKSVWIIFINTVYTMNRILVQNITDLLLVKNSKCKILGEVVKKVSWILSSINFIIQLQLFDKFTWTDFLKKVKH